MTRVPRLTAELQHLLEGSMNPQSVSAIREGQTEKRKRQMAVGGERERLAQQRAEGDMEGLFRIWTALGSMVAEHSSLGSLA